MKHLAILILIGLTTTACSKEKEEPKPEPSAQKEAAKPKKKSTKKAKSKKRLAALSPEVPKTRVGSLPTTEDLEKEAAKTIASENLEAELDRLEAEIVGVPN